MLHKTLTPALSHGERESKNKSPKPSFLRARRWFRASSAFDVSRSADKHLVVSIAAVNWARRGSYQYFQASSDPGKNRGHLARRLNHLSLDELSRVHYPFVCGIDRAADHVYLLARHFGRFVSQRHDAAHLFLNQRRGFRQM